MSNQEKISREISGFIGERVQQSTVFIVEQGLNLVEDAGLFILQKAAKNDQVKGLLHSNTPELFRIFNNLRTHSPLLPLVAGGMARKSAYLGLKIGIEAFNLSKKVIDRMGKK